jgi:hypothetical protein
MSYQTSALLARLSSEEQSPIVRRLRAILASPQARITVESSHAVLISEIEPTWRARQKVAKLKKKRFFGLSGLLSVMKASPKGQRVRIMGVIDGRESGTLFFDAQSDRFLGAVVVAMSEHAKTYFDGTLNNGPFRPGAELAKTA